MNRRTRRLNNVPPNLQQQQPQQVMIDTKGATETICKGCQGIYFEKVFMLSSLSHMAPSNPTKKDLTIEKPTYICRNCGLEVGKEPVNTIDMRK